SSAAAPREHDRARTDRRGAPGSGSRRRVGGGPSRRRSHHRGEGGSGEARRSSPPAAHRPVPKKPAGTSAVADERSRSGASGSRHHRAPSGRRERAEPGDAATGGRAAAACRALGSSLSDSTAGALSDRGPPPRKAVCARSAPRINPFAETFRDLTSVARAEALDDSGAPAPRLPVATFAELGSRSSPNGN